MADETVVVTEPKPKVPWIDFKSKTFWTAVAGIVGAACSWYLGTITAAEALPLIWGGIMAIFIRQTAANTNNK